MQSIKGVLTPQLAEFVGEKDAAKSDAVRVKDYTELIKHVAQLSYVNKDHLLFFRGQATDYKNKAGASSFYPTIYRGERLAREELAIRFEIMQSASKRLVRAFQEKGIEGAHEVKRRQYIRWSILQHYGVCSTPLLDFTHSVRVACSFAALDAKGEDGYVYVFGLPYVTNRISLNSEQDLVNVRLLSICPPDALRPYFQEGYLAGTDEITDDYDSKDELDFTRRLIAKFMIPTRKEFWDGGGAIIPREALYPANDRMRDLCAEIEEEVSTTAGAGQLGRFLQSWAQIESRLFSLARQRRKNVASLGQAVEVLAKSGDLEHHERQRFDQLRRMRNAAVHRPLEVRRRDIDAAIAELGDLRPLLDALKRSSQ